ncbi:hypothetical protein J6590_027614 [Homalodisca vitripennis]|nr:hypothetical protein J6590_027614 [Homalodisca vitripennis]
MPSVERPISSFGCKYELLFDAPPHHTSESEGITLPACGPRPTVNTLTLPQYRSHPTSQQLRNEMEICPSKMPNDRYTQYRLATEAKLTLSETGCPHEYGAPKKTRRRTDDGVVAAISVCRVILFMGIRSRYEIDLHRAMMSGKTARRPPHSSPRALGQLTLPARRKQRRFKRSNT